MSNNYIINENNFKNYIFFNNKTNSFVKIERTGFPFFDKYSIIDVKTNKKIYTSKNFTNIKKILNEYPMIHKNFSKK